ncbi:YheC/YheD family endospore coat-associated protein [Cytobacillus sp. FSL R7-0680]|uniref:YheC/YheD family endospore coat-associated protein n=1 Tax=Cytobacillus sp. FSL R7-0680 TaxID=2921689 RepID=UPI0030FA4E9B
MMTRYTNIKIRVLPYENKMVLELNPALAEHLLISNEEHIRLSLGQKQLTIRLIYRQVDEKELFISQSVFDYFNIPFEGHLMLVNYIVQSKVLSLGPIIAIMTDFFEMGDQSPPHFRTIHQFCHEINQTVELLGGIAYVCHPKDIKETEVHGYINIEGEWKKQLLPLPDVIYNRVHSRKIESSPSFANLKNLLYKNAIPFFNEQFLSKKDVYDFLFDETHLRTYLPETADYSKEKLLYFIEKYPSIFIKPVNGSQGKQIIHIRKNKDMYAVGYSSGKKAKTSHPFHHLDSFISQFEKEHRTSNYIIQEGIPLIQLNKRPIDFRILCHKNRQNIWKVTSAVARISNAEQFVSNLAQGGEMRKPLALLTTLFDKTTAIQILALMKEISIELCTMIDQKTFGLYGELGIDMGVDYEGHLWMIEANSKPSKQIDGEFNQIRPSARALVEYCTFLAFST